MAELPKPPRLVLAHVGRWRIPQPIADIIGVNEVLTPQWCLVYCGEFRTLEEPGAIVDVREVVVLHHEANDAEAIEFVRKFQEEPSDG